MNIINAKTHGQENGKIGPYHVRKLTNHAQTSGMLTELA